MTRMHERSLASKRTRRVLIVDDEMINREILGAMLPDDYNILFAVNGAEALDIIRDNKDMLSLVLLDLLMPVMSGTEVLKALGERKDEFGSVPVIVITADRESEIECLELGAVDFIPKPFPDVNVVRARVERNIELFEDRAIIQSTERDPLTDLYNKEFFYSYAEQFDKYHDDVATDAIIIDINHFHTVNERYGRAYGDEALRRIGGKLLDLVSGTDGIVARREADTFMVYCPHLDDPKSFLDSVTDGLADDAEAENRIRLRMGVYPDTDKSMSVERRFDRAKMAADTVKGSFTKTIAFYDSEMHERELYSEQLIEDFYSAIRERQFAVYFQPKFNVEGDEPVLSSAEALVRWKHPELGMISPGVFIPLFEDNGLIRELDSYVWREACRHIREWDDKFGCRLPVSVNVSRIDLYHPGVENNLKDLVDEFGLNTSDLLLEITESAYTQDSTQMTDVVEKLRSLGFRIEMDDFGTGYSSLNMVSDLPFDVMKLDMQFIRSAFAEGGDTRMLELIIDIAEYLNVPVIAEGVETEEQMKALKLMGCNLIQGYYFSKPVPGEEFERFIEEKLRQEKESAEKEPEAASGETVETVPAAVVTENAVDAGEGGSSPESQAETHAKEKETSDKKSRPYEKAAEAAAASREETAGVDEMSGIKLRTFTIIFMVVSLAAALALFISDLSVVKGYNNMQMASDKYLAAQKAATQLETASDNLTDNARCFVVTGDIGYLNDFFVEVEETRNRDKAVDDLGKLLEGKDPEALESLESALLLSNGLLETECRAMRLKVESGDYDISQIPDAIMAIELTPEEKAMSPEELDRRARDLVFNSDYQRTKGLIREKVSECTDSLINASSLDVKEASSRMAKMVNLQTGLTILYVLTILALVLFINLWVRRPLSMMVELMREEKEIPLMGAKELQFVTKTYNAILRDKQEAYEKLSHEASHDALTGLLNRGAYDMLMESMDKSHIALIIVDVDNFKGVNDTYGHAVGDKVLQRVAEILKHSFRSVDIICRIGGDEFIVVMTRVNSAMSQLVLNKIENANDILQHPKDGLPPVSLSVGVAFSDRKNPTDDLFTDADTALYRVKEAGRNGCMIY